MVFDVILSIEGIKNTQRVGKKSYHVHYHDYKTRDSFYHIFTTPYLFFLTLFSKWHRNTQCDIKKLSHERYHIDIRENM
jgi:hypothetical protein